MYTEWTIYVVLAGIAFVVALVSILKRWLKADEESAIVEAGLQQNSSGIEAKVDLTKPELIADDETAVARLCFGWGGGGMIVGILSGAATHGFVGALLGSVILSAAAIGLAVIIAITLDKRSMKIWNEKVKNHQLGLAE